jgi:peptidoglycan/xylan/chitin deacetylase (PgdA/CDA1 family)
MPVWKQLLLNLYYYGSYPARVRRNARLQASGRAPVMVLFYHRIADEVPNPWTTSTRAFARQIRWLSRHFEIVSLAEAQRRLRGGRLDRPCVAITFDDGYADNCRMALPLLIERRIPCTYFVSTRHILQGTPFPHDVARGWPLAPNTPAEICELARAGVEIGAHTRTHADLGRLTDADRLYEEVVVARHELQELTGASIRYFAFPYGQRANLTPEAFCMAREAGYEGVCSAYGGFNFPGNDPFHLQRIHVDEELIRLKNWTTIDPRKLRSVQRYDYLLEPSETLVEATPGACT